MADLDGRRSLPAVLWGHHGTLPTPHAKHDEAFRDFWDEFYRSRREWRLPNAVDKVSPRALCSLSEHDGLGGELYSKSSGRNDTLYLGRSVSRVGTVAGIEGFGWSRQPEGESTAREWWVLHLVYPLRPLNRLQEGE